MPWCNTWHFDFPKTCLRPNWQAKTSLYWLPVLCQLSCTAFLSHFSPCVRRVKHCQNFVWETHIGSTANDFEVDMLASRYQLSIGKLFKMETFLGAKLHVGWWLSDFAYFVRITPLSAQISASKFQNLSQILLKVCGVWKNRGVWLTQNLKTHSKFWKLTQIFGEQFQGIEVVVTSKVADNLDVMRLVSWC